MIPLNDLLLFAGAALIMVLTPGPNMIYLAAGIASWFARHPLWLAAQRYVMGGVLAALAARLAFEQRQHA